VPRGKAADYEQAVNYLEAAARVAPGDAEVHSDLGQAYLDRGQELREHFVDELRRWDQVGLTGLALFASGPVPAAATMAAWRDVPRPYAVRLSAGRRKETYQHSVLPALRHFAMARRLCPLLPRPHMRFAAHAGEMVSHDPPVKYWERALKLAPFDPDLWYFAGVQLIHEGRAEEAWSDWKESLKLTPKPKYDHQLRKYRDRLASIIAAVGTGGTGHPSDADARRRAEVLLRDILPDRPDDLVAAATIIDPKLSANGPVRPLLDRALALLADSQDGLTGEDYFLKGQIHEALGDDDGAVRAYKHALTYAGSRPEWRRQLVKLLMSRARWKEAQTELPALLRAMPDSQEVKDWVAEVDRELLIQ
jgi:tetratricopeptide (TPR) repeat protein